MSLPLDARVDINNDGLKELTSGERPNVNDLTKSTARKARRLPDDVSSDRVIRYFRTAEKPLVGILKTGEHTFFSLDIDEGLSKMRFREGLYVDCLKLIQRGEQLFFQQCSAIEMETPDGEGYWQTGLWVDVGLTFQAPLALVTLGLPEGVALRDAGGLRWSLDVTDAPDLT